MTTNSIETRVAGEGNLADRRGEEKWKNKLLNLKKSAECLSNVLITGESNFDERNVQLIRGSFLKK